MIRTCDLLPPRLTSFEFEGATGCTLERGHTGPHHDRTLRAGLIAWEDDFACRCCTPEEIDRCAVWWSLGKNQ